MTKIITILFLSLTILSCMPLHRNLVLENDNVSVPVAEESQRANSIPPEDEAPLDDESQSPALQNPALEETSLPGVEIFSFQGDEPSWYTVDDDVMGGISSSNVDTLDSEFLRFFGTMSLDNNGGFSSVRSAWSEIDLSEYDGLLLRVYGDGKIYRFRIRSATVGSEISYNALFETNSDAWGVVYVPFESMIPTYRGFIMDVDALDTASIGSFGFMLSDKQPGEFELKIDWIRAVNEAEL